MKLTEKQYRSILVDGDFLTEEQFDLAAQEAEKSHLSIDEILIKRSLIADDHLGELIAYYLDMPFVRLQRVPIELETLNILPESMAEKQLAIVFNQNTEELDVAMYEPSNISVIHALFKKTGKKVNVFYATRQDIEFALRLYHIGLEEELSRIINQSEESVDIEVEESAVVQIVNLMLRYAYDSRASDIHIEPVDDKTCIRFRIDGILHDVGFIPLHFHEQMVMRIKVLSNLRTDEHRLAQDGKFIYNAPREEVDVRVSIVPITDGEKVVLRLLSEGVQQFSLDSLGLEEQSFKIVQSAIRQPHGMVLATGPTGSGKTTTLYAVLKILNTRRVNIATVEDPVEYDIAGVNQIQVDTKTNLTFAAGLRSIVRQDPDVIMVGEIRDEETAGIAVNSAMTGHLLLSTLHTNDAATTLPRLLDMDIESFLIASTINVVIAQRLVRKICNRCVQSTIIRDEVLEDIKRTFDLDEFMSTEGEISEVRFYKGTGCSVCSGTGYAGRTGIFEVMEMTEKIKDLIMKKSDASEIRQAAKKEGMVTMYEDGLKKALRGVTTIEEVMRVIKE